MKLTLSLVILFIVYLSFASRLESIYYKEDLPRHIIKKLKEANLAIQNAPEQEKLNLALFLTTNLTKLANYRVDLILNELKPSLNTLEANDLDSFNNTIFNQYPWLSEALLDLLKNQKNAGLEPSLLLASFYSNCPINCSEKENNLLIKYYWIADNLNKANELCEKLTKQKTPLLCYFSLAETLEDEHKPLDSIINNIKKDYPNLELANYSYASLKFFFKEKLDLIVQNPRQKEHLNDLKLIFKELTKNYKDPDLINELNKSFSLQFQKMAKDDKLAIAEILKE